MDDGWEPDGWEADDQIGGLAAATRFPLQPGMAIDVFFNKPDSGAGTWKPGFYRGIVDTATKPTAKTKSQKVEVDFPGDMMQFGDYAGKGSQKQGQVQVIVDPSN